MVCAIDVVNDRAITRPVMVLMIGFIMIYFLGLIVITLSKAAGLTLYSSST